MRHHLSITVFVTSSFLLGLAGCAADSMKAASESPPASSLVQAPGETVQPPSGAVQESGNVQPPPRTELPSPPASAGEQGQKAQGEPLAAEIQERAVPRTAPGAPEVTEPRLGRPPRPIAPGVTKPMVPGVPAIPPGSTALPGEFAPRVPSGNLPLLQRLGPTPSLTAVANGFELRHKSVTTLIIVAPNLPVTKPVEISIGYYSPAGTHRITQSYVRGTGNRFLYNDPGGDGKPRQMRVDISLMEANPGGQPSTFAFSMQINLDPLYDVTIRPLSFTLFTNCDFIGKSEIAFGWTSPDHVFHPWRFSTSAGKHITLDAFAWARTEVSASANLQVPTMEFSESDPNIPGDFVHGYIAPPPVNLVPGVTRQVITSLQELSHGDCTASAQYNITYTLRWYPYL